MFRFIRLFFFSVFILLSLKTSAQNNILGTVKDAETGEFLAYTNIQIADTYIGTITNANGEYSIHVEKLPAVLIFKYIGYRTKKITIHSESAERQDISLDPVDIELPGILITGEDPAMGIMRKVIEKKEHWQRKLQSFKADAYTRISLENDTAIVMIAESTSDVHWHKTKGIREVIKSRQETSNLASNQNFAFAGSISNLYDDNVDIMGFKIPGPTHPNAHKYYQFKLTGERGIDENIVVDIEVIPRSGLTPSFSGRISILLDEYAMIEADLVPNEAVLLPPPFRSFDIHFRQQFSSFGKDFWLPVDARIKGGFKIKMTGLEFPEIRYSQVSRLSGYQINIEMPDSIYAKPNMFIADSSAIVKDTLLIQGHQRIPLTPEEESAWTNLDSTMTLEKAFKPSGFLAKFVSIEVRGAEDHSEKSDTPEKKRVNRLLSGITPDFHFNRVDGAHIGLKAEKRMSKQIKLKTGAAYKTGLKDWSGRAGLEMVFGPKSFRMFTDLSWFTDTHLRTGSAIYPVHMNTANVILRSSDHFDYYNVDAVRLRFGTRFTKIPARLTIGLNNEYHKSLEKTTDWKLFQKNSTRRINPAVDEGRLRSLEASLVLGNNYIPWGITGQNRFEIHVEYSDAERINSDFSFTRLEVFWDGRIPTFHRRRILTNTLDFRIAAGTSNGELPVQKLFGVEGALNAFRPFGTFKSLRGRPLEGDRYAAVFWEHNFRTVPFEIIGLRSLAKRGWSFIIHGASGRTWFSCSSPENFTHDFQYDDNWVHELGASISGIFDIFRIDFTKRLDRPGIYFGVSAARLF